MYQNFAQIMFQNLSKIMYPNFVQITFQKFPKIRHQNYTSWRSVFAQALPFKAPKRAQFFARGARAFFWNLLIKHTHCRRAVFWNLAATAPLHGVGFGLHSDSNWNAKSNPKRNTKTTKNWNVEWTKNWSQKSMRQWRANLVPKVFNQLW